MIRRLDLFIFLMLFLSVAYAKPECDSDQDCAQGQACVTAKTGCPGHESDSTCATRACVYQNKPGRARYIAPEDKATFGCGPDDSEELSIQLASGEYEYVRLFGQSLERMKKDGVKAPVKVSLMVYKNKHFESLEGFGQFTYPTTFVRGINPDRLADPIVMGQFFWLDKAGVKREIEFYAGIVIPDHVELCG